MYMKNQLIVGIDEAGRGPLAGPVVASAVVIIDSRAFAVRGVDDSKKLSARAREDLYKIFTSHPQVEWGIGMVSEKQIDKINIFQATRLAMKKAFHNLSRKLQKRGIEPDLLIVDGTALIDVSISQKAIVKADATIVQCMAASIVAKVTRDRLMLKYHKKYPEYGFDSHKGYGTRRHIKMLTKHGSCPIHRQSFAPIKAKI